VLKNEKLYMFNLADKNIFFCATDLSQDMSKIGFRPDLLRRNKSNVVIVRLTNKKYFLIFGQKVRDSLTFRLLFFFFSCEIMGTYILVSDK
jgi:hypothetical protein